MHHEIDIPLSPGQLQQGIALYAEACGWTPTLEGETPDERVPNPESMENYAWRYLGEHITRTIVRYQQNLAVREVKQKKQEAIKSMFSPPQNPNDRNSVRNQ